MPDEYISRETLRDLMYTEAFERDTGLQRWDSGLWIRYKLFENCIDAIPAADVVEVRHESWKDIGIMWIDKTNQPDGISTMFCPACERYATRIYYYGDPTDMMNYCPNCGAKMDGGQDDV